METKGNITIVAAVIALIIGAGIGYVVAPTSTGDTVYVDVPGETEYIEVPGDTVTVEVQVPALSGTIPIGVLYANTGHIDTGGIAANIAIEEVNEYVNALGLDVTFELVEECAEGSSTLALEKFQSMVARGVKVVAGPNWSGQCKAIKEYADANHIVVFSEGSTSPVVAIPDDYIFRLPVTDSTQNAALAPAIYGMGIEHLIVVARNDAWGDGNYVTIKELFEAEGGVIEEYLRYDSEKTEFAAEAAVLNDLVIELNSQYGADKVALATWSFEFSAIFAACEEYPALVDAMWFGSNGFGRSTAFIDEHPKAHETTFLAMIMGTASSSRYNDFNAKYLPLSGGRIAGTYTTHMYDIVWLLCKSILESGTYDGAIVQAVLPIVAEQYWGACGWTKLNECGDRAESSYELWTVALNVTSGLPAWYRAAVYDSGSRSLTWILEP
jgi:branched-chain amino acid transport system substrate-binding protein